MDITPGMERRRNDVGLFKSNKNAHEKNAEQRQYILDKNSDFYVREAYKALRTNIIFAVPGDGCRKVCITSAMTSEGKSITSLNMAISFAETGKHVLLIDADMRRPNTSRLLNLQSSPGLSNVLARLCTAEDAIYKDVFPHLDVLLSGVIPPNPSELLGSEKMKELLDQLSKQYDYIFIDTPPVNVVTDVTVLAPLLDGVVLVVRQNSTERGALLSAVSQMEFVEAKLLGFILNGTDSGSIKYGYGKYRRSKYGYRKYGHKYGYSYGYAAPAPENSAEKEQ